jgi:hypothetical protein
VEDATDADALTLLQHRTQAALGEFTDADRPVRLQCRQRVGEVAVACIDERGARRSG